MRHAHSSGKLYLPSTLRGVAGIQPSPLLRVDAKARKTHQGSEDRHGRTGRVEWAPLHPYSAFKWSDPALFAFTDQGMRSIRTPQIDHGLHLSSVDRWLLSDLDFGFDDLTDSALRDHSPGLEACSNFQVFREATPSIKSAQAGKMTVRGKDLALLSEAANRQGKRNRAEAQLGNLPSLSEAANRQGKKKRAEAQLEDLSSLSEAANRQGKRMRAEVHLECQTNLVVDDVRAIFQAVRGNYRPPKGLKFQIVLGTAGQKISPPSFEFGSKFEV